MNKRFCINVTYIRDVREEKEISGKLDSVFERLLREVLLRTSNNLLEILVIYKLRK